MVRSQEAPEQICLFAEFPIQLLYPSEHAGGNQQSGAIAADRLTVDAKLLDDAKLYVANSMPTIAALDTDQRRRLYRRHLLSDAGAGKNYLVGFILIHEGLQ